jgi:hypothetical protein
MARRPKEPSSSWREHIRPGRRHSHVFSSAHITMGAIHMAGMIVGILAADKMKSPGARWSAIAGFGIATGIGEILWRDYIDPKRGEQPGVDPS